ncbi:hypothetical protein [Vibrio rotiferianus]|uniref:hypothetical protein n=1 Tax=Vibrio rotiferianus TaxID=190895 RepID=UPI0039095E1B
MFKRHTILHTESNSINFLIVDVNHRLGKIAYYDLNQQPQRRKSRSENPKRSSVRPPRIQRKPLTTSLDEFATEVNRYDYRVEMAEYQNGLYIPKQLPKLRRNELVREREISAEENYELIRPIVEDEGTFFEYLYTKRGHQLIKQRSSETGVKVPQIARLLAQYCHRGRCRNAMYPNYQYCGCNYQPVLVFDANSPKRGRPGHYLNYRNRLPEDDKKIEEFLRRLGKRLFKRHSYTQMYRLFDFYYQSHDVPILSDESKKTVRRVPLPVEECISESQFYYYIKKLENNQAFAWRKNGEQHFLREYQSRFGRAREDVPGPSFRYEIDATVEDVYLAFPFFTRQRLSSGRPTTYRVCCTYSGMVAGVHAGVGGPNWEGVMQALYIACSPKKAFCARFDIDIEDWEWPCSVVPNELTIDNGVEYPSKNMQQFLDEALGIDCINYTEIYAGERKGGVEGGFSVDKDQVIKFMPGYVERMPEKGDSHASNFAVYTYYEFMRLLIMQTLIRNNESFKNNIHDKVMSEQGVPSTSLAVWEFGMKYYMNNGRGKIFPSEQLLFSLLPSGTASTTSRGLKFKGLHYSCDFAHSQGWLTDNKNRPVKKINIRYYDADTNQIWYRYEGKIYSPKLNDHSEIYRNLSWFDALHRLELYSQEKADQKQKERDTRIQQKLLTSEITKQAKKRLEGTQAPTSKSPVKNLSITQDIEKRLQQNRTAQLFRDILSPNDDGHPKVAEGMIQMPYRKQTTKKNLRDMYGDNKK